jgi:hypothetical protein
MLEIPDMIPVVEISQSEESIATVAEPFPRVVTPVELRVEKAPGPPPVVTVQLGVAGAQLGAKVSPGA